MPEFKVTVKWGKERYKDVEVNTDESPETFMAQLFALTGVPVERQKVMMKGQTLKPDGDWSKFKLKDGSTLLLMGTAGEVSAAPPEEQTVFVEDLPETSRLAKSTYPPGLVNLGNTCYMNSTVQCLATVPDLRQALVQYSADASGGSDTSMQVVRSLGNLLKTLDTAKDETVIQGATTIFLLALRSHNPRFAEQQQGHYAQQDASECWNSIMRAVQQTLPAQEGKKLVDTLFTVGIREKWRCAESDEPETINSEKQLQLSCHIEKDTNFVITGLKQGLSGEITKRSESLGRDAVYTKTGLIERLPQFLTVNFVRFYFKRAKQENCKIRKEVKFPMKLDMFELCTDELQKKLVPAREKFAALRDWQADNMQQVKKAKMEDASAMDTSGDDEDKSETGLGYHPVSFEDDPGSNNSGYYDLTAVLTHRGRSSDSGHYVAWVKLKNGQWVCFDDDKVTPQKEEDILKLSGTGGADWHTAYILLYSASKIPKIPEGNSQ